MINIIEQDYIMRLIKELVRMTLKVLFNIDMESPVIEMLKDQESKNIINELIELINCGAINEAENKLFEFIKSKDERYLEIGLLFYYFLNEKDDDFLAENNFSRDEIRKGLRDIMDRYGLKAFENMLL